MKQLFRQFLFCSEKKIIMYHCLENYKEQKLSVHWLRYLQSEMS